MKTVVVIDSGLNVIKETRDLNIKECIVVRFKDYKEISFEKAPITEMYDDLGHGTGIATILGNYSKDTNYIFIKAFHDEEIEEDILIATLEYVYKNISCDYICLSCGCVQISNFERLKGICKLLSREGVVIVAGFSNDGAITYPACFEEVIGVDYSMSCFRPRDFFYIENASVNIRGIGYPQRLPKCEGVYVQQAGSSFVVPHIVGCMLSEKNKMNLCNAKSFLRKKAKEIITMPIVNEKNTGFKIGKAAIFPYSKETDVLLRYNRMLDFKIEAVLSTKYQLTMTRKKMKENEIDYTVCLLDDFNWDSVDAIIVGHVNMLSKACGVDLKKNLIEKCIEYKKNIFLFDDIDNDEKMLRVLSTQGNKVFCTRIQNYENTNFGKLHVLNTPVLGVFGTGPKQGKYTLQLMLKEYLTGIGYKVANFATEPTAPLFGFEICYPYGYNSGVKISGERAISYVNSKISELDSGQYDLIIVGAQSQTIQTGEGNIGFYNYPQYELILGTQPDAYFLCVYANDDISYIKRTISFLESINDSKVIGIIVFPFIYDNVNGNLLEAKKRVEPVIIDEFKKDVCQQTGKPAYSNFDYDFFENILEMIQNVFQ